MSWDDLPPGVQRRILSLLPMSARLRTCSLVNRTMCEAAAAATQQLHLELDMGAGRFQDTSLEKWLTRHGQHVTSLQLSCHEFCSAKAAMLLQLPCPRLQQLHLQNYVVLLDPSSTCAHSTRLTKLVLDNCSFKEDVHKLAGALMAMSHLQHLALLSYDHDNEDHEWEHNDGDLPSGVLQHLPQLTHLSLSGGLQPYWYTRWLAEPTLQHVSTLQHLQELRLGGVRNSVGKTSFSLTPSTTPGISCLTAITRLELRNMALDVAVLQPVTKLRKLSLVLFSLPSMDSMAALLNYISQLVLLQSLELICPLRTVSPTPVEAYAGLTASSTLQDLEVDFPEDDAGRHGLWQHLFPVGRTLLHCTSVEFYTGLGSSDITSQLVSCCPLLRSVTLGSGYVRQLGAALMSFTQLTALTALDLYTEDQGCIRPVSALTGLRRLKLTLWDSSGTELRDYLPLTCLQRLTQLMLDYETKPHILRSKYEQYKEYEWSAREGEPHVCEQLLQKMASLAFEDFDASEDSDRQADTQDS